jgi:hypothetical protein
VSEPKRGPIQFIGHVLAQIVVGIYVVVDSIIGPIFRPFMRWLSSLHVIQRVEEWIGSLPPYVVLVLFLVPLAIEEVTKFYGLVLLGGGHVVTGLILYVGAHVFAILICERIFSAGKDKLLTIGWFAKLFYWLKGYKDRLVDWFKGTETYKTAQRLKASLRDTINRWRGRPKASGADGANRA